MQPRALQTSHEKSVGYGIISQHALVHATAEAKACAFGYRENEVSPCEKAERCSPSGTPGQSSVHLDQL